MQLTPEIIAAAREFHELGGCNIVKRMSDFEVHNWFLDLKNNDAFPGKWYDNYKDRGDCIPIWDVNRLWKWLIRTVDIEMYEENTVYGFKIYYMGNSTYIPIGSNLHAALYSAAVHVAKEKA